MIISAAPFRISFAGGSSDIPCFYRRHPGAVLSTTIDKYIIDEYYMQALNAGALGGKLAGAGGAGFLLLYVEPPDQEKVRAALADCFELPFKFDRYGSRIIHVSDNQPRGGFIHGPA